MQSCSAPLKKKRLRAKLPEGAYHTNRINKYQLATRLS